MRNKVIYTSLVGGYDDLHVPKVVDSTFDYICFSNDILDEYVGVWKIVKIPFCSNSNLVLSRFAKLNPHLVLPEYEYSIWIDANMEIISEEFYFKFNLYIMNKVEFALLSHPLRESIYDEIEKCLCEGIVSFKKAVSVYNFLVENDYPADNGLFENGIMFRKHGENSIVEISKEWWWLFCRYAQRDQFYLSYLFWKQGVKPQCILPLREDIRNSSLVHFENHKQTTKLIVRLKKKIRKELNQILYISIWKYLVRGENAK